MNSRLRNDYNTYSSGNNSNPIHRGWVVFSPGSSAPTVFHNTKQSADLEAERLAILNKGKNYLVLQVVSDWMANKATNSMS